MQHVAIFSSGQASEIPLKQGLLRSVRLQTTSDGKDKAALMRPSCKRITKLLQPHLYMQRHHISTRLIMSFYKDRDAKSAVATSYHGNYITRHEKW